MKSYEARIIITSCNKYSELIDTVLYSYQKHWPDREFPITIALDYLKSKINSELNPELYQYKDKYWSNILLNYLKNCKEEIILLALDDFILRNKVNNQVIFGLILNMKRDDKINYIRLIPRPKPKTSKMPIYDEIKVHESYRVSLQASLWRKKCLLDLLEKNESPWQFELYGTERAKKYEGFYGAKIDLFPYKHHVIQRGKWFPWSYLKLKVGNYPINQKKLKIMNFYDASKWIIHKILSKIIRFLKK